MHQSNTAMVCLLLKFDVMHMSSGQLRVLQICIFPVKFT